MIELTNLDKIYFPKSGITKGDIIAYYEQMAPIILPHLKNRPQILHRHPNGIEGKHFFQKNARQISKGIPAKEISHDAKKITYLLVQDKKSLLYLVNLGCIEINPFCSTIAHLDYPDYLVLDLDPVGISYNAVIETALAFADLFDEIGMHGYPKTSGGRGMHIYVPLKAKYPFPDVKDFAHLLCTIINDRLPKITSLERDPKKRKKRVYLDYLQNKWGASMAAPYSVRPIEGAPVSTPVEWKECKKGLNPHAFTIETIRKRVKKKGDLFKPVLQKGIDFEKALERLQLLS